MSSATAICRSGNPPLSTYYAWIYWYFTACVWRNLMLILFSHAIHNGHFGDESFQSVTCIGIKLQVSREGQGWSNIPYRLTEDLHTHTLVLEGEMRMLSGRFASTSGDCQRFMLAPTLFLVVGVDWIRDYNFKANWAIGLLNCITSHEIKGVCRNCNIYFFLYFLRQKKNNRSVIDRLIFFTFFELLKIHVIRVFF